RPLARCGHWRETFSNLQLEQAAPETLKKSRALRHRLMPATPKQPNEKSVPIQWLDCTWNARVLVKTETHGTESRWFATASHSDFENGFQRRGATRLDQAFLAQRCGGHRLQPPFSQGRENCGSSWLERLTLKSHVTVLSTFPVNLM